MFEEKTWQEVTTPDHRGFCPVEGGCSKPDEEWRQKILERLENMAQWPNVHFVVFVQNVDLCSSHLGAYNVIVAGPGNTWTAQTLEELKQNPCSHWYGDLPSTRLYPQWYISRENHLKAKEATKVASPV